MATSKLQIEVGNLLDKEFPEYRIRENFRPDWMISSKGTRLELDFYIEEIKTAFEIQGQQHYQFTPFFHKSIDDFTQRVKMDDEKKELCSGSKITFYEIFTKTDALIAIYEIKEKYKEKSKYIYSPLSLFEERKESAKKVMDFYVNKIKALGFNNGKERDLGTTNSKENMKERLETCMKKLKMYNDGQLTARPEKVITWKKIIENNGHTL